MRNKLILWWQGRSERERKILLVWIAIVSLLLLVFGVIEPLSDRITVLEKRIPTLEVQLNKMRSHSGGETRRVQTNQNNGDLRSTLFSLLADKKIQAELRALSSLRTEIRLPQLPIREAIDLLDSLRQESGSRVVILNIKAEATTVQIVAELERAQ